MIITQTKSQKSVETRTKLIAIGLLLSLIIAIIYKKHHKQIEQQKNKIKNENNAPTESINDNNTPKEPISETIVNIKKDLKELHKHQEEINQKVAENAKTLAENAKTLAKHEKKLAFTDKLDRLDKLDEELEKRNKFQIMKQQIENLKKENR